VHHHRNWARIFFSFIFSATTLNAGGTHTLLLPPPQMELPVPKKTRSIVVYQAAALPPPRVIAHFDTEVVKTPNHFNNRLKQHFSPRYIPIPADAFRLFSLSDVVRFALAKNPIILIRLTDIEGNRGNWQSAYGEFDTTYNARFIQDHTATPFTLANSVSSGVFGTKRDTSTLETGFSKKFTNGMVFTPSVSIEASQDTLKRQSLQATENRATVDFAISIPLLRDRTVATTAPTLSAKLRFKASIADAVHEASLTISNSIQAYWDYHAALLNWEVQREAEKRAKTLLKNTRILAEKNEVPRSDIDLAKADYNIKLQNTLVAQNNYYRDRATLAGIIGLDPMMQQHLPSPKTPFPKASTKALPKYRSIDNYVRHALEHREDLKARNLITKSNKVLAHGARASEQPQLNLGLDVGYSGLHEGNDFFSSLNDRTQGANYGASLDFSYPINNNERRGEYRSALAAYMRASIEEHDLARNINIEIHRIVKQLPIASRRLSKTAEAVRLYKISVDNERIKFRLGEATIIDVIRVQDQLLTAELNNVNAKNEYAKLLIQFMFETGTLITQLDHLHYNVNLPFILGKELRHG